MRLGHVVRTRSGDSPTGLKTGPYPVLGAGGVMGSALSYNVIPGELLVGRVGTVGSVQLVCEESWATDNTIVVTPNGATDARWVAYCLRAAKLGAEASAVATAQPLITSSDVRTLKVVPADAQEQRRIADFLDDRVARIDQIITARRDQINVLEEAAMRASYDAVRGEGSSRRGSGLAWLGTVPTDWPVLTVNSEFQVELGKMLDEKRQTGTATIPYLRNTNVQWDRVDITDLKSMDVPLEERARFTVWPGDLLICEGGQPGRSAIYSGDIGPLGFQKALHRARSRGRSRPEWLLECLRVAVHLDVFAVENGQTTIGHLTNEQIRSTRFPFPSVADQDAALVKLNERWSVTNSLKKASLDSIARLQEYKQSLITAAVTGELDVTTAGRGIPG